MTAFDRFRASLPAATDLHRGLIGNHFTIEGPFGPKRMIYADYVASGRAHEAVERFVMEEVLPWYANSHTEASHCGGVITRLRAEARAEILRCTGGGADHAVVFTGSGATSALNRLAHLFGAGPGVRVIVGPYEHHSNLLPWRESGAEVIQIAEGKDGGPDRAALARALDHDAPLICTFSAASNVTGIMTDVAAVTRMCKDAGARVIWDYAGGAPYLPIDMGIGMDAVVVSAHKFIGGPGASGVMILRRDAVQTQIPSQPGGGTVRFVNDRVQDYSPHLEDREEGGTPNVVGDIRAALVFAMKDAAGQPFITAQNTAWWDRARARLSDVPGIHLLGDMDKPRLPILSFVVKGPKGVVHHTLATQMLSDAYGVQARGGCACAGPYVHDLLDIGPDQSDALRDAVMAGDEMARPGFVRLNLCWAAPQSEVDAILDAVCDLPAKAPELERHYSCDTATARFTPNSVPPRGLRGLWGRLRGKGVAA